MTIKTRKISITALVAAVIICLSAVLGLFINSLSPKAAGTVTVSNVFTASGDASFIADRQSNPSEEAGADEYVYYTAFTFGKDDDAVSYRRNLAYNWFARPSEEVPVEGEEGKTETKYGDVYEGFFNMEIGFGNTAFDKFVIRFESQQYVKTKDGKSQNYVIFYPHTDADKVYAMISTKEDTGLDTDKAQVMGKDHIIIKFTDKYAKDFTGGYEVYVGNGEETVNCITGKFENVGGNYAKSSTSSTSPVYPLTFSAKFDEKKEDGDDAAKLILYSLNGQNFKLTNVQHNTTGNYYYGGNVTDDTPAVLCLEEQLNFFTLGSSINVDYAVIDVLRTSPRATLYYYVLTYEQYTKENFDYNDRENFKELTSSDTFYLEPDRDKYYPENEVAGTAFDNGAADEHLKADLAVKVYFTLTDVTSNSETDYVYLDWYLDGNYKLEIKNTAFIAAAKDTLGAKYKDSDAEKWAQIKDAYQKEVDKAAKNLSAGSSSYLYLPSVESLFEENGTAYTDMKYSIYYYGSSQLSNTSLNYNNLSINVTRDDDYVFTVYATDASGNNMYYLDEDGKIVEFAASEIWTMFEDKDDKGLAEKLPWFHFTANYKGVQFEEQPGTQATAYVGTAYNSASFKINGISGYKAEYRLFLFDRAAYYKDHGSTLNYSQFLEQMDGLFDAPATRGYFTEIPAKSSLEETDSDYDKYSAYEWNSSSLSFVPQDNNAFYMIRAEVTEGDRLTDTIACNLGIAASVKAKTLKGESDWLKNNVASVVLLCVAGLALVGIVLLLVIKPKDKGDLDEQFEAVRSKKKLRNK
ncbi:MAG: hypothetical protein K2N22_06035 [Clostridia bacterium]|nr:hypothetical protein [Clostridia bacterium]